MGPLLPVEQFECVFAEWRNKKAYLLQGDGNLGDALIHRATVSLFEKFGIDSAPVEEAAVIFYGGGGNMGEFYPTPKGQRESLLKLSKDLSKPLVVLPQSFVTPDDFQCYRIFVRERESQRLRPDAILAPDLVLGLEIEDSLPQPTVESGLFLREDYEGIFKSQSGRSDPVWSGDYIQLAARYRNIVTDRLHFAIVGLILGRTVTLLPNMYFKNRAMYDAWLRDLGCKWRDSV
jgi:exopolysaccharide biosynthesis predicted pyruvyltransferase EpsI